MKKIFTLLLSAMAVVAVNAQTNLWNATLTPVSEASELGQLHTHVAADKSVFVTSTYNTAFDFGGKTVSNDDAMTSAYIAKYDNAGAAKWIVTLYGNASVRDITTDAAGNVYAVGSFTEEVELTGADGNTQNISGSEDAISAFVMKLDANGAIKAVRSIATTPDAEIENSFLYYPEAGDVKVVPVQICVSGDRVYMAAEYTGDLSLDNASWQGSYLNVFDFMYMDISSFGILSLSATDLTDAASVAYMQALNEEGANYTNIQENPQSCRIAVEGTTVYAAFVGKGNEVLVTPNESNKIELNTLTEDEDTYHSYPVILTKIVNGHLELAKMFDVEPNKESYGVTDQVNAMTIEGNTIYIGGTFFGELGFDTSKKSTGAADMYVAAVSKSDFTPLWSAIDGYDEGDVTKFDEVATGLVVVNGEAALVGYAEDKNDHTITQPLQLNASSTVSSVDKLDNAIASISDNGNGVRATLTKNETSVNINVSESTLSGISSIRQDAAAANKVYTLDGRQMNGSIESLPKGVYITNGKKIIK